MKRTSEGWRRVIVGIALSFTVAGPGWASHLPASHLPPASIVRCAGNDDLVLEYRHILADIDAIQAHGNCRVHLVGMHVTAGGIAVLATGNAEVLIERSFVQGARAAIQVTGNAVVRYRGSTLRGAIRPAAGGRAIDDGGSVVERLPDPVRAPLATGATLSCGDRDQPSIIHRWIDTPQDALEVRAGCRLTLSDSHLRAGGWGIRVAAGGEAIVRNSLIEAGEGGIEVADGGVLYIAGSSIPGGVQIQGSAAVVVDGGGNSGLD